MAGRFARAVGEGLGRTLDLLLPPQCVACGVIVASMGKLCGDCWARVDFIRPPLCEACGQPFATDLGPGALCAACATRLPTFRRARAVMRYGDVARDMILGFKHGDRTHAARGFGEWLAHAGASLIAEADLCLPVPIHRWRLARRRFNQAALLARALSKTTGLPIVPDALVRVRASPSQGGLSRLGRARNVQGAFRVFPRSRPRLEQQRVLLIDDVYTTGATISECTRILQRAGAASVDVLTLARVIQEGS